MEYEYIDLEDAINYLNNNNVYVIDKSYKNIDKELNQLNKQLLYTNGSEQTFFILKE